MSYPLWILVANGSRARAFERQGLHQPLLELHNWVHPATRLRASELHLDHPGPGHRGRGALGPRVEQRHKARHAFAHELSQWLQERVARQNQGALALFVSNPFLGELMAELPQTLRKHVCASHPVDLTDLPFDALASRLRQDYRL